MYYIIIISAVIIYIIGVTIRMGDRTVLKSEIIRGTGMFGGPTYHSIDTCRDVEPKDAWLSLLWPLEILLFFIRGLLDILHEILVFILLLVGIQYKKTKLYKHVTTFIGFGI